MIRAIKNIGYILIGMIGIYVLITTIISMIKFTIAIWKI